MGTSPFINARKYRKDGEVKGVSFSRCTPRSSDSDNTLLKYDRAIRRGMLPFELRGEAHCVTRNLSHRKDVAALSLALSLSFTPDARSHEGASENARFLITFLFSHPSKLGQVQILPPLVEEE
jgi:hypothetical protein